MTSYDEMRPAATTSSVSSSECRSSVRQPIETSCPVCQSVLGPVFFSLPSIPTTMNRALPTAEAARQVSYGKVALCTCPRCGVTTNIAYKPLQIEHFDQAYDCAQQYSEAWRQRVIAQVDWLHQRKSYRRVVEIGCGDGWVLSQFRSRGFEVRGFDPTYEGENPAIEARFYEPGEPLQADLIYVQHVLDEVASPRVLLDGLARSAPEADVFLDVLDASAMFAQASVWDIAYELVHYFHRSTLQGLFSKADFFEDPRTFLRVVGRLSDLQMPEVGGWREDKAFGEVPPFSEGLAWMRKQVRAASPTILWGASNRGGNLANWLDPDASLLTALVDINPAKQGGFLPGTGHPIWSPATLFAQDLPARLQATGRRPLICVANDAYTQEVREMVAQQSWEVIGIQALLEQARVQAESG